LALYEIVLRRRGSRDEVRLTDHTGGEVGETLTFDAAKWLVVQKTSARLRGDAVERLVLAPANEAPLRMD
jgi:hypothetical protein